MAPDGHFASRSAPFDEGTAEICQSPVDNPNGQDFSALLTAKELLKPAVFADLELVNAWMVG